MTRHVHSFRYVHQPAGWACVCGAHKVNASDRRVTYTCGTCGAETNTAQAMRRHRERHS